MDNLSKIFVSLTKHEKHKELTEYVKERLTECNDTYIMELDKLTHVIRNSDGLKVIKEINR